MMGETGQRAVVAGAAVTLRGAAGQAAQGHRAGGGGTLS